MILTSNSDVQTLVGHQLKIELPGCCSGREPLLYGCRVKSHHRSRGSRSLLMKAKMGKARMTETTMYFKPNIIVLSSVTK
jgi:hypothetical protein